ncbi:MAG TPA: diiron oxygenase [Conexibacter sp.]|nr:diiron oxygenase [Conexibacter sp.]
MLRYTDREHLLYFPPEMVPLVDHPLVRARGEETVRGLLLQRLYIYLDFTAELEQRIVNPVCAAISRNQTPFTFPDGMREDAFKIYTDEAWHAQFSDDLQRQLERSTGQQAALPDRPAFITRLEGLEDSMLAGEHLAALIWAIVSETLISSILAGLPRDPRLVGAVRHVVGDHAVDEGIHHAYFASVLEHLWIQLDRKQREAIGREIPMAIRAFLEPDRAALVCMLKATGFSDSAAATVISDSYSQESVDIAVRRDAQSCLRHLAKVGALEGGAAVETLEKANLLEVNHD